MMVVVWTEGKQKKYISKEQVEIDEKRASKHFEVAPSQNYLYIPRDVLLLCLLTPSMQVDFVLVGRKLCLYPRARKLAKAKKTLNKNLETSPDEMLQKSLSAV